MKPLWLLLPIALAACSQPGRYTLVDDYTPAATSAPETVIRPGDVLNIRVFQQESMSALSRVRADGKISMPFLNDVTAAGFSPAVLGAQLQTRLKDFINNPVVTVSLEEVRQLSVSVLGEVPRPGIYNLEVGAGVLQALAAAGGFTPFAHRDLFVVRSQSPAEQPERIRLDYHRVERADGKAATFALRHGDILLVE